MTVMDGGRMLLNGQGQDHDSSGLNNIDIKAEVEVRGQESDASVIYNIAYDSQFCYKYSGHGFYGHVIP